MVRYQYQNSRVLQMLYAVCCNTADSFFHLYKLFGDTFISNHTKAMMFKQAVAMVRQGNSKYQLKHVNWFFNQLTHNRVPWVDVDNRKLYLMLVDIGFFYEKIRIMYHMYRRTFDFLWYSSINCAGMSEDVLIKDLHRLRICLTKQRLSMMIAMVWSRR